MLMAFTDFTLEMVLERFSLEPARVALFANVVASQPSAWLLETLERYKPLAFTSEKSRSEFLIAPILSEARAKAGSVFSIYF